jgi:hypothetical protein
MIRTIGAAMMALALAGCGRAETGVYDLPLAQAYDRLEKADIAGFRTARQCGLLIHLQALKKVGDAITWQVTSSGRPMLSFTVDLDATDAETTRATIRVSGPHKSGEAYDGDEFYVRPALNQPLRPAVQELIDAAMAQRPYDVWNIPQPINTDKVCSVQRASIESRGKAFSVDDKPGDMPGQTRRDDEEEDTSYGEPMDRGYGE